MAQVLNKVLQFLVPKDKKFIPLLEKAGKTLVKVSSTLNDLVNGPIEERDSKFELLSKLDDESGKITREINLELSRNFLTPFDREDIHELNVTINDVVDFLNDAGNRMMIYSVDDVTKSIKRLTEINLEACQLIKKGIECLAGNKKLTHIAVICKKINELEEKADKVYDKSIAKIFDKEKDAKNIIKYKEVLSALEEATDRCKNVSNILESVMVKYS